MAVCRETVIGSGCSEIHFTFYLGINPRNKRNACTRALGCRKNPENDSEQDNHTNPPPPPPTSTHPRIYSSVALEVTIRVLVIVQRVGESHPLTRFSSHGKALGKVARVVLVENHQTELSMDENPKLEN